MSVATPNIDQMVARLTQLSPQMLQQYAAQHQNDTMALLAAKAASDAQKKIMAARPAQQTGTPPKVNEQVVASIAQPPQAPQQQMQSMQAPQAAPQDQGLPEDSGIAQLPAPNMQGMAGGGIVAFDEGGEVPRFQSGGTMRTGYMPYAPYAPGVSKNNLLPDTTGYEGMSIGELISTLGSEGAAKVSELLRDKQAEKWQNYNVNFGTEGKRTSMAQATKGAPTMPTDDTRRGDIRVPADGALKTVSAPYSQREGVGGAAPAGPRAPQGGGLTELYKKTLAAQGEATDPYEADRNEVMKSRQAMAGEELTDAKARKEGLAALLGGRESRIKGREERAEKAENLNTKMAVINAGLAMMQSTGKGLSGIAEGATKGMGMYAEGLKLTAAERQKIEDAKDSFDELRFNSENLTQKEITAAKNKVSEVANMTKEKHIDALMKREDINRETAGKLFEATVRQNEGALDRANRLQAAGISAAGATSAKISMLEQLGAADPKSPLYKGYLMTVQEGQEPMLYKDYQTKASDELQGAAFLKRFPTFELYKAGMSPSGGGNFVKPPAGAATPIYPR